MQTCSSLWNSNLSGRSGQQIIEAAANNPERQVKFICYCCYINTGIGQKRLSTYATHKSHSPVRLKSRIDDVLSKFYKLKRCSNKECCKQCRYVKFKCTMTKWPVQKLTQGTTQKLLQHHDATDIKTNYIFVLFWFLFFYFLFIDNFLNELSKKCWATALVRSMTFIGSLNQF